jgi:hypothetical protein
MYWIEMFDAADTFVMTRRMASSLAEKLAPIVLPEATGGEVRLGSLWENGPTVIVFLRHYG